eukprot:scaffold258403_cov35-Tisochrysis_lutea.AAC.2
MAPTCNEMLIHTPRFVFLFSRVFLSTRVCPLSPASVYSPAPAASSSLSALVPFPSASVLRPRLSRPHVLMPAEISPSISPPRPRATRASPARVTCHSVPHAPCSMLPPICTSSHVTTSHSPSSPSHTAEKLLL